ncbi:MAG: hypothetical protein VCB07_02380 [Gammaproteobacteria bacterium]
MKIREVVVISLLLGLGACSMLPGMGDDGEKRVVRDEKIKVSKVYISKGRAQCEDSSGKDLPTTKEELQGAGIKVFSSECGTITGIMAPALCGSTTLHINIHGIDNRKFSEAESLGYKPTKSFKNDKEKAYEIIPCG